MSGIAGIYTSPNRSDSKELLLEKLSHMQKALKRRGPKAQDLLLSPHCGLVQTSSKGVLPVAELSFPGSCLVRRCYITYDGELFNRKMLREQLQLQGLVPYTDSDAELILLTYLLYGTSCPTHLDGAFAFAIYDELQHRLLLVRDPFGVKPLFYARQSDATYFASEPKAILAADGIRPVLAREGLCELFGLGPAKNPGSGIFSGLSEVLPGTALSFTESGIVQSIYYKLCAYEHEDNYEDTLSHTKELVKKAVIKQMPANEPAALVSGGLDSSIVSAICAEELAKEGRALTTYSFEFEDNGRYFHANAFQPDEDRPYALKMAEFLGSSHHILTCSQMTQAAYLTRSVDAHDGPCMADIDSSLLYFCEQVHENSSVVLTGECADEVFDGYPWLHNTSLLQAGTFPWMPSLAPRKAVLSDDVWEKLQITEYVSDSYSRALKLVPVLPSESAADRLRRQAAYLDLYYFMQTLLVRMDRASTYAGLSARVPFADPALVSYAFNMPWSIKSRGGEVKHALREAMRGLLPEEILHRPKCPYPKTYHPAYELLLAKRLEEILADSANPLFALCDRKKVYALIQSPKDYGAPWYGQLMAGPQMMAYLIQMEYFLSTYQVQLRDV